MADRLLNGRLAALLDSYTAKGLSYGTIAQRLYAEGGVEVTDETLRSWHGQLKRAAREEAAS